MKRATNIEEHRHAVADALINLSPTMAAAADDEGARPYLRMGFLMQIDTLIPLTDPIWDLPAQDAAEQLLPKFIDMAKARTKAAFAAGLRPPQAGGDR